MSSTEEKAYEIAKSLDVDYVLIIFGGMVGYSSDGEKDLFFIIEKISIFLIFYF